jgi:hypothetical protein
MERVAPGRATKPAATVLSTAPGSWRHSCNVLKVRDFSRMLGTTFAHISIGFVSLDGLRAAAAVETPSTFLRAQPGKPEPC